MQILYLQSISGDPQSEHVLLAPKDMPFPEDAANLVIRRVADSVKDLTWDDVRNPLKEAGFVEPDRVLTNPRPWDESRTNNQMTFKVRFPAAAPHEHAGKELVATNGLPFEDGRVVLVDEHKQFLQADDRLWDRDKKYMEQVDLGPVELPHAQFASVGEYQRALKALTISGFVLSS